MAEAAERTRETAAPTTVAAQRTGLVSLAAGVGVKKTLGGVLPDWVVVLTGSVLVGSPPSASSRRSGASCFRARRRPSPTTPPAAGTAVRAEQLSRAGGARRPVRHLVWAHQRDLTSPSSVISSRAICSMTLLMTVLPMVLALKLPLTSRSIPLRPSYCLAPASSCAAVPDNRQVSDIRLIPSSWKC